MVEIPEAHVIAQQLKVAVSGKKITHVETAHSPHKFAWYQGDPKGYASLLETKMVTDAYPLSGTVEIRVQDVCIALSEGVNIAYYVPDAALPEKHQLLLRLEDGSTLTVSIQMYGGILCFREGQAKNPYYLLAKEKPSPLTTAFDRVWFDGILSSLDLEKLSAKALLATEQRIPGLGNGVLQDILFNARIHPKRKVSTLAPEELSALYQSIKETLQEMAVMGGRDTEKDLFGNPGAYMTKCSKNTAGKLCAVCANPIEKSSFMGGSIYFCPHCQPLESL